MDKDYLFRYGIALHLLNNNVDGWEYIESLNENEYRDLHKQFNQLAKFRGINDMQVTLMVENTVPISY